MKNLIIILTIVFMGIISVYGGDIGDGELLIVPQGEVIATAGGASSSIGLSSSYINPAYLSNLSYKFTLNTGIFNKFFNVGAPIVYLNLATTLFPKLYLYLGYVSFGSDGFTVADYDGTIIADDFNLSPNTLYKIGFAYTLFKGFNAGIIFSNYTQHYPDISDGIRDRKSDSMYLSSGVSYNIKKLRFGLSIINGILKEGEEGYHSGTSLDFTFGTSLFDDKLNLNMSLSPIISRGSKNMRAGLGIEYNIANLIFLRLGYIADNNDVNSGIFPGLGVKFKHFRLDYTFSFGEFSIQHYISLTFGLKDLHPVAKPKKKVFVKKEEPKEKAIVKKKYPKPAKKILVAVLDFEGKNIDSSDAGIITDFIRQDMINSGYFTVLERSAIKSILKEVNFQQSGCTSAECAVQIGKVLAVRKMIVGSVSKLGKKYFIALRMVDVETSQIDIATSIGVSAPIEELPSHVNKLVDQMIESIIAKNNKQ